jgi:HD-like signal output (HDOD) protein
MVEKMATQTAPSEFEGRISKGKDWREIVAWVGDLPPMPHVASRAISMIENPDTTAVEISELLSSDAALAARVLKIANSAMFSRQREVTTLSQAVMLVGFKALKGVIVAATLRQMHKSTGKVDKLIWENSMCTAMTSTILAKTLKKRFIEEIFLLGLLHGLGQIVFLHQQDTSKQYKDVLAMVQKGTHEYIEAEQLVYGFAHPLIGALVAKKWNFSAETCQVILHYRDLPEGEKPENELEEKTAIVQLADMIAHKAGIGSPEGYPNMDVQIGMLTDYLAIEKSKSAEMIATIIKDTQTMFNNERAIYE